MPKRNEILYLFDCLTALQKISVYSKNLTLEMLADNDEKQDAILRELEIAGESLKNVSNDTLHLNKNIDWKPLKGLRDILTHGYFIVEIKEIFNTVTKDLPVIKEELHKLINIYIINNPLNQVLFTTFSSSVI